MRKMKFVVIGLGSMGSRRIRLLQAHYPEINIVGVDSSELRQEAARNTFNIETTYSLSQAYEGGNIDAVLICTSPISHEAIIREALGLNLNIFTEINLLNHYYEEIIQQAEEKKCKLYLSSTLLHREEMQYIQQCIQQDTAVTYRYHVGQYLPDWHPWESYKDFFVAHKATNGCREIFAIELPWIIEVFGRVESISVEKQKITTLDIDYPDTYQVLVKHETGVCGVLSVNVVSRVAKRELDIIGEMTQISWRGTPDSLFSWSHQTRQLEAVPTYKDPVHQAGYASNILENAYLSELTEFIDFLEEKIKKTRYSFPQDFYVVNLINQIEEYI